MAELYDTVLQTIKDRCPGINWKLGGLMRELLIEPINAMQDAVSTYITTALRDLDLATALSKPAENASTLDAWMARLRIATPKTRKSSGEITILMEPTTKNVTIPNRTTFNCGDVQLVTTKNYVFSPAQLTQLSEDCWSCTVPVTSSTDGCFNIAAGSPATWEAAPSTVIDMYVSTAVTGGTSELTAQEKANLITAELESGAISGEQAISTALRKAFPGAVVSALVGYSNVSKMPLYVKMKTLPTTITETLPIYGEAGSRYISIPRTSAVTITSVVVDGVAVTYDVVDASDSWEIRLAAETSASEATITYSGFTDTQKVSAWLNATQRALPYKFECRTPVVANIKLFINTDGAAIDLATRAKLQEYICDKPLNDTIHDSELIAILASSRYTVQGAILYSVTVSTPTYTNVWSSSGSVSPAGQLNLEGAPVALYTTIADIVSY